MDIFRVAVVGDLSRVGHQEVDLPEESIKGKEAAVQTQVA